MRRIREADEFPEHYRAYPDRRREEQLRSIVLFLVGYQSHGNKRHYQQEDDAYRPEVREARPGCSD